MKPLLWLARSRSLSLALVAGLLGGALWLSRPRQVVGGEGAAPELDRSWPVEAVDRITLGRADAPLILERGAEGWRLRSSYGYRVEDGRVRALIEAGRGLSLDRLATRDPGKHAAYELGDGAVRLRFFQGERPLRDLLIGRPGPRRSGVFVRRPEDGAVYFARPFHAALRSARPGDWLQGALLPHLATGSLRRIALTRAGSTLVLEKTQGAGLPEDGWRLTAPVVHAAKPVAVRRLLSVAAGARMSEGLDPSLAPKILGLDAPRARLELTAADGSTRSLAFGKGKGGMVYVRSSEREGFFKVSRGVLEALKFELEDLKETNIFAFDPAEVRALSIDAGASVRLRRGGEGWLMESPERGAADAATARAVLSFMAGLLYRERLADADLAALGLDDPRVTLRVETGGGTAGLAIGAERDGQLYVRRLEDGAVFTADPKTFAGLPLDLASLRGGLFGFLPGQVKGLVLERRGQRKIVIQRGAPGRWFGGYEGRPGLLRTERVLELAGALARFKASELAATQDARASGLAPYAGRVIVELEGASPPTQALAWGFDGDGRAAVASHEGQPIYRVEAEALRPFELELFRDLRDRRPLPFPQLGLSNLREIAVKPRSGEEVILRRADSARWRLSAPDAPAVQAEVAGFLRELIAIEASALETDLSQVRAVTEAYEYEVRLVLGNLTGISLLLGAQRPDGSRLAVVPVRGAADAAFVLKPEDAGRPIAGRARFEGRTLIGREVLLANTLTITPRGGASQSFTREVKVWHRREDGARGSTGGLGSLLINLEKLRVTEPAEASTEAGFSPPLWRLVASIPSGEIGLEIGAAIGGGLYYVRRSDQPERVWRAQANLVILCLTPLDKLLDRRLFSLEEPELTSLSWTASGAELRLERGEDRAWRIAAPAGLVTDGAKAQQAVDAVLGLEAEAAAVGSRSWTAASRSIVLRSKTGATQRLELGAAGGGPVVLARTPRGELALLAEERLAGALPTARDLERRSVLALPVKALRGLSFGFRGGGSAELALLDGAWVFREDGGETDDFQLRLLTKALEEVRDDGPPPAGASLEGLGLAPPRLRLEVKTATAERTLELGAESEGGRVACRIDGGEPFLASAPGLDQLASWRTRRWLEPMSITQGQPASVTKIVYRVGGRELSLTRRGADWLLEPGGVAVSDLRLSRRLYALTFLRGKRPTATRDPKAEGLEPPWFSLTLTTKGGEDIRVDFAEARGDVMAVRRGDRMVMAPSANPLKAIALLRSLAQEAGPK